MRHFLLFSFVLGWSTLLQAQNTSVTSGSKSSGDVSGVTAETSEALDLYRSGKFDEAIEKYRAVLQQDPKSGDAYAGLARCYLKEQRVQEAFDAATQGIAQVPDSMATHTALAETLFRKGDMYHADVEWVKAANANPPNARAFLGLSRLDNSMSLYAKARKMIERAHDLDPDDPDIKRRWLSTLPRAEQIRVLEQYLAQASPDDSRTREGLERRLQLLKARQDEPTRSCKLVGNAQGTETRLERLLIDPQHLHGYGLKVDVNGQTARLLLDTGASGLLINKRMAEKAGVKPLVQTKLEGVGDKGPMGGYIGYADSIKVGGLQFENCLVEVSEKRSIVEDDGLIGADVFSHFLVTIDFPDEKLQLTELPKRPDEQPSKQVTLSTGEPDDPASGPEDREAQRQFGDTKNASSGMPAPAAASGPKDRYIAPEMQAYTPIYRFGHQLLIPTKIGDAPPKLFLIDTGGFSNMISADAAREITKVRGDPNMHVRGVNGSVKNIYRADKVLIQFARFRQENDDLIAFDLSPISRSTGTEVSGILGFTMLRMLKVKIDYRDGLVDFDYKPNPWQRR